MAESTTIRWDQDADGVVVLTLDDPNQSANTMNRAYAESILAIVERLEASKDQIAGVLPADRVGHQMRSTTVAMPMPPPTHSVARP